MPLVSARMLAMFIEPLSRRGLPLEAWIEGLAVSREQLAQSSGPIEYESFVALCERASAHLGGPEELEQLAFDLEDGTVARGMEVLRELVTSPDLAYRATAQYVRDQASPPYTIGFENPSRGHVVLTISIGDDVPESQAVWHWMRGMLRRVPRPLGLPPAEVRSELAERQARFDVRFAHMPVSRRLGRLFRRIVVSYSLIRGFQAQQRELQRTINELKLQSDALRESEARNRELVAQLEIGLAERTGELESRGEELRELQQQLIQAERLGAAHELAGSVAHAINNPLTALIGQVQMVLESSDPADPRIERVHQVALRIRDVVSRTLQLFRRGELNLGREDPRRILEDVAASLRPLAAQAGVQLGLKCEAGIPTLEVDGVLLRAALASLGENAIEASSAASSVDLELTSVPSLRVLEFRIADAGSGIPPGLQHQAQKPFFTTKPGGTGLGLAIAQGVVAGHRGRLRLLARPGGGTIAAVELPLAIDADGPGG